MNEEAFLSALRDDPADEATWLALTDWLDEEGQADRAELLRLTRQLRAMPVADRADVRLRVVELLAADVRPVVVERTNSLGMRFALVPPGTFVMGSPEDEDGRTPHEQQHPVTLTRPFWLGVFPVTQGQWTALMDGNPSHFCRTGQGRAQVRRKKTGDFPVDSVTWENAAEFVARLDARSRLMREVPAGYAYRLPTEAEWEYACRGGAIAEEPFCLKAPSQTLHSSQANVDGTHAQVPDVGPNLQRTCKVGSYDPNPLGLYDLHGNVWEWCHDWYDEGYFLSSPVEDPPGPERGSLKVYRGGSWMHFGYFCRAAFRSGYTPRGTVTRLGFRVALGPVLPA